MEFIVFPGFIHVNLPYLYYKKTVTGLFVKKKLFLN